MRLKHLIPNTKYTHIHILGGVYLIIRVSLILLARVSITHQKTLLISSWQRTKIVSNGDKEAVSKYASNYEDGITTLFDMLGFL